MKFDIKLYYFILVILLPLFHGCVEPFDVETETFESVLIIEATLTNEIKNQQVKLSRASQLEDDGILNERNATVFITANSQNQFTFSETEPGIYSSDEAFEAQPDVSYQLFVTTDNGVSYSSEPGQLQIQSTDAIEDLYADRTNTGTGQEGISVFIDNTSSEANAEYYRYEYIETYKVIAPFWSFKDLVELPEGSGQLEFVIREKETQTCYRTVKSNRIILGNTNSFAKNQLTRFPIRFIDRGNYIPSNRYSILVMQYVLSQEAFAFYETLRDFSRTESLFSENQPGFFGGNVVSETNPDEKVVGFFDVSGVSEKRLFFEYRDFFPDGPLPDFVSDCPFDTPLESLVDNIRTGNTRYFSDNTDPQPMEGPYLLVPDICGDCTVFGSNIVPDFWIE